MGGVLSRIARSGVHFFGFLGRPMRARKGMALFSDTFGHEVCEYLRNSRESLNFEQSMLFAYSIVNDFRLKARPFVGQLRWALKAITRHRTYFVRCDRQAHCLILAAE
jgi:hypothetical protein